jgi:SAM-dependent methyltransferase
MIDHQFLSAFSNTFQDCRSLEEAQWFAKHLLLNKLESKTWLSEELLKITKPTNVLILGSWYTTYLPYILGEAQYTCVDLDPTVEHLSRKFNSYVGSKSKFKYIAADAKSFLQANRIYYDVVINTSCEHMSFDMKDVLWDNSPIYVFQSNNYAIEEHVNYKNTLEEFVSSTGLSKVLYSGTMKMPKYDRYMVIGKL